MDIVEQGLLIKGQTCFRATNDGKMWWFRINHILKGHTGPVFALYDWMSRHLDGSRPTDNVTSLLIFFLSVFTYPSCIWQNFFFFFLWEPIQNWERGETILVSLAITLGFYKHHRVTLIIFGFLAKCSPNTRNCMDRSKCRLWWYIWYVMVDTRLEEDKIVDFREEFSWTFIQ